MGKSQANRGRDWERPSAKSLKPNVNTLVKFHSQMQGNPIKAGTRPTPFWIAYGAMLNELRTAVKANISHEMLGHAEVDV